jgi:hypothetical protein
MSDVNVTLDMVDAVITSAFHGMKTEGATFGTRTTEGSNNKVQVRTVDGVALQDPETFTDDVHGGAACGTA